MYRYFALQVNNRRKLQGNNLTESYNTGSHEPKAARSKNLYLMPNLTYSHTVELKESEEAQPILPMLLGIFRNNLPTVKYSNTTATLK